MKKYSRWDNIAIALDKRMSVKGILSFCIFFVALNTMFPSAGQTAALIRLVADTFHVPLPVIGFLLLISAFIGYALPFAWKARLIGILLYALFLVGCYIATWHYQYSWQGAIIYSGFGFLLLYLLLHDYVKELQDEAIR